MTSIVEENGSSTIENLAPPEPLSGPGSNSQQGHSPIPSPAVLTSAANIVHIIPSQQTSSHQVCIV